MCWLIFLNREDAKPIQNVRSWDQAKQYFDKKPSGTTPLSKAIETAYSLVGAKPVVLIIATDGAPNSLEKFTKLLRERDPNRIKISILACSDRDSDIGYLNKLDKDIPALDVLDDYKSERKEVKKFAKFANYTLGDHVARLCLAAYEKYDKLDGV